MKLSGRPRTDLFTAELLTPYVRKLLEEPDARVRAWEHELVKGDLVPPKRGIFHLRGTAQVAQNDEIPWSMFLKIARQKGRAVSQGYFDPTQREALFYDSPLSREVDGSLRVPTCLGLAWFEDDAPWVFLKEVTGTTYLSWPIDRYGVAARHLGQFQGEFLSGRSLPPEEWADRRHWLQLQRSESLPQRTRLVDQLAVNPITSGIYAGKLGESTSRVLRDHDKYLGAAMNLPSTVIHGDFNPSNLIAVLEAGVNRTVALDWDYWGVAQMGIDTCTLIGTVSIFNPVPAGSVREFVDMIFAEYLAGLREAGWRGDTAVARFAVVGLPAFVLGTSPPTDINRALQQETRPDMERRWGRPAADIVEYLVDCHEYLLELADEASALVGRVHSAA